MEVSENVQRKRSLPGAHVTLASTETWVYGASQPEFIISMAAGGLEFSIPTSLRKYRSVAVKPQYVSTLNSFGNTVLLEVSKMRSSRNEPNTDISTDLSEALVCHTELRAML